MERSDSSLMEEDPCHHHLHHRHRTESSMNNLALLMREQDADLLESMHFATLQNEEDETPLRLNGGSSSPTIMLEIPYAAMELEATDQPNHLHRRVYSQNRGYRRRESGDLTEEVLPEATNRPRRALSGDIWTPVPDTTTSIVLSPTSEEENGSAGGSVDNEYQNGVAEKRGVARTESLDRRINEAAQFAEVVGDIRAADQETLRIIDEEDRDDDDDDENATVIRLEPGKMATDDNDSVRQKVRPQWPFQVPTKRGFLAKLPDDGYTVQDYIYKGIRANPPEVVKRGTNRGNYSQLHRKAWLEVSDKYHRYGKNLRLYYRYWESLGYPTNMFFDWLDSKGEAAGQPLPELEECPRSQLDSDTVLYITNDGVTQGYALTFNVDETFRGKVLDVDGDAVTTGSEGWIFVLRDNVFYGAQKVTSVAGLAKQRFHHSSFFGGKAVACAGIFVTDDEGVLTKLYPHSGHYRPGEASMQRVLFFLHSAGVDLTTFEVDMQQILHIARDEPSDGEKTEKKKKVESLFLVPGVIVACFLAHKARFIGEEIFANIHLIRQAGATSVSEVLEILNDTSAAAPSVQSNDNAKATLLC